MKFSMDNTVPHLYFFIGGCFIAIQKFSLGKPGKNVTNNTNVFKIYANKYADQRIVLDYSK